MSILDNIKSIFANFWQKKAEQVYDFKLPEVNKTFIETALSVYGDNPPWLEPGIKTVGMAATVCGEIARLTTMNIEVTAEGSARADYLQQQLDIITPRLRQWVEAACAAGEVIIKPNGDDIDMLLPTQYEIIEERSGNITKIVFIDDYYEAHERNWYSRLEYHEISPETYHISNRCYVGKQEYSFTTPIAIEETRWAGLADDADIQGVEQLLFGLLRIPGANNRVIGSDTGLPVFSGAMSELEALDTAFSKMDAEVYNSDDIVFLDSDRLLPSGGKILRGAREDLVKQYKLPPYVRVVEGGADKPFYERVQHDMSNIDPRIREMNFLLGQIGFKCGFSNGYFVFNEKTGLVTATQVESDDRRTLQTISDMRDAVQYCIDGLVYALDKMADMYGLAPRGKYEITYDMQDLTQNHEEDVAKWWSFVQAGYVAFKDFLVRCEGLTEEEAEEIVRNAKEEQNEDLLIEDEEDGIEQETEEETDKDKDEEDTEE